MYSGLFFNLISFTAGKASVIWHPTYGMLMSGLVVLGSTMAGFLTFPRSFSNHVINVRIMPYSVKLATTQQSYAYLEVQGCLKFVNSVFLERRISQISCESYIFRNFSHTFFCAGPVIFPSTFHKLAILRVSSP